MTINAAKQKRARKAKKKSASQFLDQLKFAKPKRTEDPAAIARCKAKPCLACDPCLQHYPTEAHHVTTRKYGNDSDDNLMPLCGAHHYGWHYDSPGAIIRNHPEVREWLEAHDRQDVLTKILR